MASITFTDTDGTVVLENGLPGAGARFQAWTPTPEIIGPMHQALGTGIPYVWEHREDQGASFELRYIPNNLQSDCIRLIRHLKRGGLITLACGDADNATYECYLWPGSKPSLSAADPKDLRRVLSLAVLNSEAGEIMSCRYT